MGLLDWFRHGKQAKAQPLAPARPAAPVPSYTARDLPLLNACLCAQSIPELERNSGWPERLGEPLPFAVPRLLAAGMLRPATTAERVSVSGGGTQELRELCRRNGLKISGTNGERRRRLYEKDPEIFSSVLNGPAMFICTDEGAKKAWGYRASNYRKETDDTDELLGSLRAGNLTEAVSIAGVSPEEAAAAGLIFKRWPDMLQHVPEPDRPALRVAGAFMFLTGRSHLPSELDENREVGGFKYETAARMLEALATFAQQLAIFSSLGYDRIELIGREDCCPACGKIPKILPIAAAPTLLLEACTASDGCTCAIAPAGGSP